MSTNENEAEWVLLPDKSNAAVSCLIIIKKKKQVTKFSLSEFSIIS